MTQYILIALFIIFKQYFFRLRHNIYLFKDENPLEGDVLQYGRKISMFRSNIYLEDEGTRLFRVTFLHVHRSGNLKSRLDYSYSPFELVRNE